MLEELRIYLREAEKLKQQYPDSYRIPELVSFFPHWVRSLRAGASPLTDQRPWITFATIRFLDQTLRKHMRVFEYGAGGSTIFLRSESRK